MNSNNPGHKSLRVAFVSTAVSPYCIGTRKHIDKDKRIVSRHIFARKLEPGRQWPVAELPNTFEIARGFALATRKRFLYVPLGLPVALWRFQPNVIVSEQLGTLLLFTLLYSIIARVPVLLRWEGTPHTERRYSGGARRMVRRLLASCVQGFLCYTSGAENYLRSLGQKQPAMRIPYSADDTVFYPPGRVDDRASNVFLFVGQLIHRKGLHFLIPAFCDLLIQFPEVELWVVGDGPLRARLEESVPESSRQSIRWFGFLGQTEIADLMRKAGCLVCPTLEDHGPVVQIEAARTGLPIVSTPYSGNAELVIEPGVNGYIVEPSDKYALVKALSAIHEYPDKLRQYTKSLELAARQTAHEESKVTIDAILELTEQLS